ncbi:MAG: PilZ domain-containing protein [Pseudomonadota bacterium]
MGIFNRVLQRINKKHTEMEVKATHDRLLAQINHYSALIRLQDQRHLIEVITPTRSDSFQSMIIGVDLYNQQLIIDELSPQLVNPESLVGQNLTLRHQHNRQMLKVSSQVVRYKKDHHSIIMGLPAEVGYQPRRREQRLMLMGPTVVTVFIDPIYGAPWYGNIVNISSGGMRILVTGDLRNNLHKNKPLRRCDLKLNDREIVHCKGRVKSFSYFARPYRRTEISIAFEAIDEQYQQVLNEFIDQLSIAAA